MQQEERIQSSKEEIFQNGRLFYIVREDESPETKENTILYFLQEGADVNAKDANDNDNTPLHMAVLKGELYTVKLLINNGASIFNKNLDNQTPLDIAILHNKQNILSFLETYPENNLQFSKNSSLEQSFSVDDSVDKIQSHTQVQKQYEDAESFKINEMKNNRYKKRSGTSGVEGHLYETNLLCLLLFRALNNENIEEFYLGTNIDEIEAFDDLVFKYKVKGQVKPKVMFIQAKHKTKTHNELVTVDGIKNAKGDFSLYKYLDSFCEIKQKFSQNKDERDHIFYGGMENVDCTYIIYTPAKENFSKKKFEGQLNTSKDDLIYSCETGKTFQINFDDDEIDELVKYVYSKPAAKNNSTNSDDSLIEVNEKPDKNFVLDFLDNLFLYTDQAKQDEVEKMLINEIDKSYVVKKIRNELPVRIKSEAIFLNVHKSIQEWWMIPGKASYLTKMNDFFAKAQSRILEDSFFTTLHFTCINMIKKINIKFNPDVIQALGIDTFLKDPNKQILNVITNETTLSSMKTIQFFEKDIDTKYTYIDLKYVSEVGNYIEIIREFKKSQYEVLIIKCQNLDQVESLCESLEDMNKKVIVVSDNILDKNFRGILSEKYTEFRDEQNNMINLTPESQKNILKRSKIMLQGKTLITLPKELFDLINEEVLTLIINNKNIDIGRDIENMKYSNAENYYIERKFYRHININVVESFNSMFTVISDSRSITQQNLKQEKDIVLISDKKDQFEQLCDKYKEHNIHWLKKIDNEYIWQQSHGTLSKLRKFVSDQRKECILKRITDLNDKVVIISADSGMGKSTVLGRIAEETKESDSSLWIARIDLIENSRIFKKWKENNTIINITEIMRFLYRVMNIQVFKEVNKEIRRQTQQLFCDFITVNGNNEISLKNSAEVKIKHLALLEIKMFEYFYNHCKLVILIDGFDESIPTYKTEVTKLLQVLKNSKIRSLWITTRPYDILNELEDMLSTFSFELSSFSKDDQKVFLRKFWNRNSNFKDLSKDHCDKFADKLIKQFSESINDHEKIFFSIPLHIKMIADVFENGFRGYCSSYTDQVSYGCMGNFDLHTLYKKFITIKFSILFEKKPCVKNAKAPQIDEVFNQNYISQGEKHKKLSLYCLFNIDELEELLPEEDIEILPNLLQEVGEAKERTGIINRVYNNMPVFCHQSFAEYFAANYIWERFKSAQSNKFKNLIRNVLIGNMIKNDRVQICMFFQMEAQKDIENNAGIFDNKFHFLFTELLSEIFPYGSRHETLYFYLYNSALMCWLNKSTKLLLKIIELSLSLEANSCQKIIQNMEYEKQAVLLCISAEMGYKNFITALKILVSANFFNNYEWSSCPFWLAAENGHSEIADILLKDSAFDVTKKDSSGMTLIECIFTKGALNVLEYCLRNHIVNAKPYKTIFSSFKLPVIEALKYVDVPQEIIKLLIEMTDIEYITGLTYFECDIYDSRILLNYDNVIRDLAFKKGFNFSKCINFFLIHFIKAMEIPECKSFPIQNHVISYSPTNLLENIKKLIMCGVGFNHIDNETRVTTLQYATQKYYFYKLLEKIITLHKQEKLDLDMLSAVIVRCLMFFGIFYRLFINSEEIYLYFVNKYSPLQDIYAVKCYMTSMCYRNNNTEESFKNQITVDIVKQLSWYVKKAEKEIQGFKENWHNLLITDYLTQYDDILHFYKSFLKSESFRNTEHDKSLNDFNELDNSTKSLLAQILHLYVQDNENNNVIQVGSAESNVRWYLKGKISEFERITCICESDRMFHLLNLKNKEINLELKDLLLRLCECGGISLLFKLLQILKEKINDNKSMTSEKVIQVLEPMTEYYESFSNIFELLMELDDLRNDVIKAINSNDYSKVKNILCQAPHVNSIINSQGDRYGSLLHYVAWKGEVKITRLLLKHAISCNITLEDNNEEFLYFKRTTAEDNSLSREKYDKKYKNCMPLHLAALNGHSEIVQMLINKGANVNALTNGNWSALNFAAQKGHSEVVQKLLDQNASINIFTNTGFVPLHLAVKDGHTETLQMLLDKGADVNIVTNKGWTSLHLAVKSEHTDIVKKLIDAHANVDTTTKSEKTRRTSLHIAAQNGNVDIVKMLLFKASNVDVCTLKGNTPLHLAALNGHSQVVQALIEKGANVHCATEEGWTALHFAAQNGHCEVVQKLLEEGAGANTSSNTGWVPLYLAAENGHTDIVKKLIDEHANVDATTNEKWTSLHIATLNGHSDVVQVLIGNNANVHAATDNGWVSLHFAASKGRSELMQMLLNNDADIHACNNEGMTSLHLATVYGHGKIMEILINKGSDVNATTCKKWIPLHFAAENGQCDVMEQLIKEVDSVNVGTDEGKTALHIAAEYGHTEIVQKLITNHAHIDITTNKYWTPLHFASKNGRIEVVQKLIDRIDKKNVDICTDQGETALHLAAKNGHSKIVEILMNHGATADLTNNVGWTGLHFAAQNGHIDIFQKLIDIFANVDVCTDEGKTPLHLAAENGHSEIVEILMNHCATVDLTTNTGWTALHFAAENGHYEIAKMLLNIDANVFACTNRGWSPLHLAAKEGHFKIVELLRHCGADLNIKNSEGMTALDICRLKRFDYECLENILTENYKHYNL